MEPTDKPIATKAVNEATSTTQHHLSGLADISLLAVCYSLHDLLRLVHCTLPSVNTSNRSKPTQISIFVFLLENLTADPVVQ